MSDVFYDEERGGKKMYKVMIMKDRTNTHIADMVDDYVKVQSLALQKKKQDTFSGISKSRNDAKQQLLKAVNPIIKKYMEDNKIKLVLDKAAILLGDKNLEITSQIIEELNKELKSLKIN